MQNYFFQKNVKIIILSHLKKKKGYSHYPFVFKCLIPTCICFLFEFKYFNYLYKKKLSKCYHNSYLNPYTIATTIIF